MTMTHSVGGRRRSSRGAQWGRGRRCIAAKTDSFSLGYWGSREAMRVLTSWRLVWPSAGQRLPDHGLADIEKGAELGDVRAVQIGYGVEAGQAALIKQGEEEGLHCVVIVVAQGDLVNARLQQGGVEGAPAHFGAEGAGIFLPPGLKDHMVHLGGNPVEGDAQLPAVVRQRRQVHARGPHVHRKGLHGKAPRIKLCQPGQGGQQHQGVLPPGYPHGHPLPGGDHIIVLHTPTEKTEDLLHDGYTPCAQK